MSSSTLNSGTVSSSAANTDTVNADQLEEFAEEGPTKLPLMAWVSLIGFAAFVVAFGTCAANWMFN